jgi:hypothetical protein
MEKQKTSPGIRMVCWLNHRTSGLVILILTGSVLFTFLAFRNLNRDEVTRNRVPAKPKMTTSVFFTSEIPGKVAVLHESRLYFSGNVGINIGNYTKIGVYTRVGFKLTSKLSVGINISLEYFRDRQ